MAQAACCCPQQWSPPCSASWQTGRAEVPRPSAVIASATLHGDVVTSSPLVVRPVSAALRGDRWQHRRGCQRGPVRPPARGADRWRARAAKGGDLYEDEELYETPDDFGGWKGIRESELTSNWAKRGRKVLAAGFEWFVVEEPPQGPERGTVLLVPGVPAHSYSFRALMPLLAKEGYRCVSFDWLGFGLSDKPSAKTFSYSPEDWLQGLEALLAELGSGTVTLVGQGYIGGPIAALYASAHPESVSKLVLLNPPLGRSAKLPKPLSNLSMPLFGAMFAQDPTRLADGCFNTSGPYVMAEDDLQVYRQPFMETADAGFAAQAAVKNMDLQRSAERALAALSSSGFQTPIVVGWGTEDKWLGGERLDELVRRLGSKARVQRMEGAGHFSQEDWPEKVAKAIL